jgi:hypothetical protein
VPPQAFIVPGALEARIIEFVLHRLEQVLVLLFTDHLDGVHQIGLHKGIEDYNIAHDLLMSRGSPRPIQVIDLFACNRDSCLGKQTVQSGASAPV